MKRTEKRSAPDLQSSGSDGLLHTLLTKLGYEYETGEVPSERVQLENIVSPGSKLQRHRKESVSQELLSRSNEETETPSVTGADSTTRAPSE